jgi:hypothetical protein
VWGLPGRAGIAHSTRFQFFLQNRHRAEISVSAIARRRLGRKGKNEFLLVLLILLHVGLGIATPASRDIHA